LCRKIQIRSEAKDFFSRESSFLNTHNNRQLVKNDKDGRNSG